MTPLPHLSFSWALVLVLLLPATLASSDNVTLADLVSEGHLELQTSLNPGGDIVPGQKLTLTVEIATDRWFSGGTRISLPEVSGLVVLQTEQFASNASERRGAQNWVLQRWTLDVYAQRAGEFTLPAVAIKLKVNSGPAGDVEGTLYSDPIPLKATLPAALKDLSQWVAAPDFSVRQTFDRDLQNLQLGDAFEREIVFEAADLMAMMLPSFSPEKLPGLAAYPLPPALEDSNNRGQMRASRSQRVSYVVEQEGQYLLPAVDFFWWDTSRAELQVLSLPATTITVGAGAALEAEGAASTVRVTPRAMFMAAGGLALLAISLWLARRYLPRVPLARLTSALAVAWGKVRALRKPALPERLNPGGTAGE